ncbi:NAD kinase [Catenibacterium mitsuokai]|uniref:NAD kinase n=1 Tax=Catenibacterium mitsuokai TaxID=100886 RepID=UPI003F934703
MKRYAIVSKKDDVSRHLAALIKEELKELIYDEEHPEIVISVGGDGTMIYSIHRYEHVLNDVSFVGIHTGTLGFFTDYLKDEYKQLVEDILTKEPEIFDRHLLHISYNGEIFHALNEMRIENSYRSQVIDMYVNDEHMETFRGNGLCVSTPSGSTALNKSLGGAVINPSLRLMQVTEIAGIHHNAYRSLGSPLILGEEDVVRFETDFNENAVLGLDTDIYELKDHDVIEARLSKRVAHFCNYRHISFVKRLRKSYL